MTPTPLDFAQIRTTCPKAFSALIGWFCQGKAFVYPPTADSPQPDPEQGRIGRDWLDLWDGQLSLGDFRYAYDLNVRDLFDFFDEQGLYVEIVPCEYTKDVAWYMVGIWMIGAGNQFLPQSYPTRAAAEAAAFGAGFEKLEEILGKEEGR